MSLSLSEVSDLVSRVTGVSGALIAQVAGSLYHDITNNRQQWSSLGNEAVLSFVMRNGPQELLDQMKANADATDRAMKRDLANLAPAYAGANFGRERGLFGALWNMPGSMREGNDAAPNAVGRNGANGLAAMDRWALEGTPIGAATGLSLTAYTNLRAEGYSHAQIDAAAGDLSKIRGFTPTDVSRYTPYFVGTDKAFRSEAKRVIESNGKEKFKEDDKLTTALPQAVLTDGGKIQPHQMNALGRAIYALPVDREALRRQRGEPAKNRYMIKHHRFDKDEYLKLSPEQQDKYLLERGADPEKMKALHKASSDLTTQSGGAESPKTRELASDNKVAVVDQPTRTADGALDRFAKLGAELPTDQPKDGPKSRSGLEKSSEAPTKSSEQENQPASEKSKNLSEPKKPVAQKTKLAGSHPSLG